MEMDEGALMLSVSTGVSTVVTSLFGSVKRTNFVGHPLHGLKHPVRQAVEVSGDLSLKPLFELVEEVEVVRHHAAMAGWMWSSKLIVVLLMCVVG